MKKQKKKVKPGQKKGVPIWVHLQTRERLKKARTHERETYDDVVRRLLDSYVYELRRRNNVA